MNLPTTFTLPIRLQSEANSRDHWRGHATRVRRQRQELVTAVMCLPDLPRVTFELPTGTRKYPVARWVDPPRGRLEVIITRVAPRELDSDNLARSMKAVRDQLAELLGVDDRDARVAWVPRQRKGHVREYAMTVEIVAARAPVANAVT